MSRESQHKEGEGAAQILIAETCRKEELVLTCMVNSSREG